MGDSLGKIVALILAVLLLFIYPVKNEFERLDETSRLFVLTETSKFVDSVRNLGYVTPSMYQEYVGRLGVTDNIYEVRMEHRKKRYDPVYDDPTAGVPATPEEEPEASEEGFFDSDTLEDVFPVEYVIGFRTYYNNTIMKVMFPDPPVAEDVDTTYEMGKGDYFAVTIYNKNKTIATRIQEMLYNTGMSTEKIYIRYGGMVKDENN